MSYITIDKYEYILDAIDNEDIHTIISLFKSNELEPETPLLDAPRIGNGDYELLTYVDYAINYNLTDVLDTFINNFDLVIDDEVLAITIKMQSHDTYKYLVNEGYIPQELCLKEAVHLCNSSIVDSILDNDSELVECLDEDDIDCLYGFDVDEETIETISVLFNHDVNKCIFKSLLESLQSLQSNINDSNIHNDLIFELITLLINNDVIIDKDTDIDTDNESSKSSESENDSN